MPRTRTTPPRPMLAEANKHIGRALWSFSLPAFATCPRVTFLAYTRSWRVDGLAPHLVALGSLPNVYLWWSEDRDSGACHLPGGRRCFLCIEPGDEGLVPEGADLVFRDDTRRPRKWVR